MGSRLGLCVILMFVVVAAGCSGRGREGSGRRDAGADAGRMPGVDAGPVDAGPLTRDAGPGDGGPVDAGPVTPPVAGAFSLGENHTCVIEDAAGRVRCWGYNMGQELGIGSTEPIANGIVPGVEGAVQLAAGGYHTCALLADGAVTCWGRNEEGQLGLGRVSAVERATSISGIATVTELDADAHTTCARISDGVFCWGANANDQIVAGGPEVIASPTEVATFRGATEIAVGNYHICGVVSGAVRCTGSIGPALFEDPVDSLSSGWQHSCAVVSGATYCWGDGYLGTLGDGMTAAGERPAQLVPGVPATAVEVRTGIYHSCARVAGGNLWCWGNNQGGAIDPDAPHEPGYRPALRGTGVTDFDVGGVHICVNDATGFHCWGNDGAGAVTGSPS